MKKLIYTIVLLLCAAVTEVTAQEFKLSAEIRPRSELRNGFKKLRTDTQEPAFFTEQRSRLNLDYKSDNIIMRLSLQDVRLWGSTNQIYKTDPNALTNISEAWAQYNFNEKIGVKVGRQIISYDNQRFLGGLEWAQQGRRHDAALFIYDDKASKFKFHVGLAFNQAGFEPGKLVGNDYTGVNNYKAMEYIWAHKDWETGKLSALVFNDAFQYGSTSDSVSQRQTLGLVGSKSFGGLTVAGEGYYQTGTLGMADVNAYMLDLNLTVKTKVTPITLGYQVLSGGDAESGEMKNFAPAYGTNHKFNGFMDYFYVGNAHNDKKGNSAGLQDIYLNTAFKVGKGTFKAQVHQFISAVDIYNTVEGSDSQFEKVSSNLGTEIDLIYARSLGKDASLLVGYSQMFATSSMEVLKGGNADLINNWAFVMLTFKPTLFVSKAKKEANN
ncbi:alginate export family protein [Flammeovirga agarivorans]|uniref:Alginate export family protein n=1 Tax=Flammeovirga agarivorans TaxID=2726742 RepID=A0A7X8SHS6_9BACT|nr:alginate export family protein [Flammeovirga agarivorans]NLR90353.1 alginate export family protein [Flammeovirga agarivorans]